MYPAFILIPVLSGTMGGPGPGIRTSSREIDIPVEGKTSDMK